MILCVLVIISSLVMMSQVRVYPLPEKDGPALKLSLIHI